MRLLTSAPPSLVYSPLDGWLARSGLRFGWLANSYLKRRGKEEQREPVRIYSLSLFLSFFLAFSLCSSASLRFKKEPDISLPPQGSSFLAFYCK